MTAWGSFQDLWEYSEGSTLLSLWKASYFLFFGLETQASGAPGEPQHLAFLPGPDSYEGFKETGYPAGGSQVTPLLEVGQVAGSKALSMMEHCGETGGAMEKKLGLFFCWLFCLNVILS